MTPTSLRIAGGGSQSPAALQLTADIFGLPVARGVHTHEASGLGAAIDAAVGLGIHPDITSAVAAMVHVGEVRDPDPADHARYDELYRRVYRPMYGRLRRSTARSAGSPTTRQAVADLANDQARPKSDLIEGWLR